MLRGKGVYRFIGLCAYNQCVTSSFGGAKVGNKGERQKGGRDQGIKGGRDQGRKGSREEGRKGGREEGKKGSREEGRKYDELVGESDGQHRCGICFQCFQLPVDLGIPLLLLGGVDRMVGFQVVPGLLFPLLADDLLEEPADLFLEAAGAKMACADQLPELSGVDLSDIHMPLFVLQGLIRIVEVGVSGPRLFWMKTSSNHDGGGPVCNVYCRITDRGYRDCSGVLAHFSDMFWIDLSLKD